MASHVTRWACRNDRDEAPVVSTYVDQYIGRVRRRSAAAPGSEPASSAAGSAAARIKPSPWGRLDHTRSWREEVWQEGRQSCRQSAVLYTRLSVLVTPSNQEYRLSTHARCPFIEVEPGSLLVSVFTARQHIGSTPSAILLYMYGFLCLSVRLSVCHTLLGLLCWNHWLSLYEVGTIFTTVPNTERSEYTSFGSFDGRRYGKVKMPLIS